MTKGKCKWFNASRGYGFLTAEDGKDTFVHFSAIVMEGYKVLKDNQEVTFDIIQGEKGLQAANVTPVSAPNSKEPEINKEENIKVE